MLDALRSSHDQQMRINAAMIHLANVIRASTVGAVPAKGARRSHVPTPEEQLLDEALVRLGPTSEPAST